ncbi:MAG: hypothetical protein L6407_03915, partial [Candidatus Delongbacteria bacterium]|nr:hypothetical protein [Candidatus Delongbacteria bacterium]
MKKNKFAYFLFMITFTVSVCFISCTPAVKSGNSINAAGQSVKPEFEINNIKRLVNSKQYNEAEKQLIYNINKNPDENEYRKLLTILYFKTANYNAAEKIVRSVLKSDPNVFDLLNENIEFDLYYAFISSLLRQNKSVSAGSYLS